MMKMVYKPFCLMFALTISKSASQNLTVTSECIEHGTTVKLTCETTNFASAVIFYLNGDNKGGCTTISCGTSIPGYTTPTQSGTSTEMTISNYNHSRDGGDWTCSYGVSTSIPPYKVELGNCNSSSGNGLGGGEIAGIVVGILSLVIVIVIIVMLCRLKPVKKEATCCLPINLLENADVNLSKVKTVKWTHENELFRNEDLQLKSGQPSVIPCVSMEHSGKWSCKIQFNDPRQSKTINLYLTVNALSIEAASAYSVNLLENLPLIGNIDSVKWTHNSNLFVCDQDMYMNGNVSNPSLNIICVSLEDSGMWQCKMEFDETKLTKTFEIHLQVNAFLMKAASTYPVNLLENLPLIRNIDSVKWTHNDNLFVCDHDMYMNGNVSNPSLNIICVSLEDSGMWQCKMEFDKPKLTKTFEIHLQVNGKPMEATVSSKVELLPELLDIRDIEIVDWQHNNVKVGKVMPPYTIESVSPGDNGNWLGTLYFKNKNKTVKKFSVELKVLGQ